MSDLPYRIRLKQCAIGIGLLALQDGWAAEVNKPAPKPAEQPAMSVVQTSQDDLQNLVACARMALASLTAEQIAAVAVAIKHAEDDIKAMRAAAATLPPPPETKK